MPRRKMPMRRPSAATMKSAKVFLRERAWHMFDLSSYNYVLPLCTSSLLITRLPVPVWENAYSFARNMHNFVRMYLKNDRILVIHTSAFDTVDAVLQDRLKQMMPRSLGLPLQMVFANKDDA